MRDRTSTSRPHLVVRGLSLGRVAIGALALWAPLRGRVALFGPAAAGDVPRLLVRLAGIRDLVLGVAVLVESRRPGGVGRALLWAGPVCDAGDVVATVAARRLPAPSRWATAVMAGGAAAVGTWAALRLSASDQRPAPRG